MLLVTSTSHHPIHDCPISLILRALVFCLLLHLQRSRWPRFRRPHTGDHQPRQGVCGRTFKHNSRPSVSHRAVRFQKKSEWTLIGCCRPTRAVPELHQCLSSHRIACLRPESHADLLVANETNQALARRSDGRQRLWTKVASNYRHLVMRIHKRITTTSRYISRTSRPPPQTLGPCTIQLMAKRRKAHMAMCRRKHSVQSWRIGIHRRAQHAPRLRWTRWLVSLAQAKL